MNLQPAPLSFHIHIAHSPSSQRRRGASVLGYVIQHRQRRAEALAESKVRIGRKDPHQLFRPVIFKTFRAMQRGVALVLHLSLWTWLVKSLQGKILLSVLSNSHYCSSVAFGTSHSGKRLRRQRVMGLATKMTVATSLAVRDPLAGRSAWGTSSSTN